MGTADPGGNPMSLADFADFDRQFGISGVATVVAGNGGLPKVAIATPDAVGEIYLHGAHVTGWQPRGSESVLFVSSKSRWESGRAIRGGVPICFPWFGNKADDPTAPAARVRAHEGMATRVNRSSRQRRYREHVHRKRCGYEEMVAG